MVVGAHSRQQGVGRDRFCTGLNKAPNNDAMMVGSRRLKDKVLDEGVVHIGQFEKLDIGRVVKETFEDGSDSENQYGGKDAPANPMTRSETRVILKGSHPSD